MNAIPAASSTHFGVHPVDERHSGFDTVDAKLEGVGGQFELTTESRIIS
ncbi:hypothetical protein PU629_08255 [Pullulanibacillus sp. KACC 23026]|nr:hypothetical protein [Pullulanibacillus sp. KACC 23026]WEG14339.1 hypothetical protein PU629_08255 [Pullulanibacillus sp. KACC 23026]